MAFSDISDPASIKQAITLFDEIGRDAFLDRFGYGKAKEYFLVHNGKFYDSKAILGVAHQFQFPDVGPLLPSDFSGGELTAKKKLRSLGFEVQRIKELSDITIANLDDIPHGSLWKRREIHRILGGQQQGGISTPADKPYIIIFSGPRGEEFGYKDGWQEDGFYHYTGEGQEGNMTFTRGNKAIRDHAQSGKVILLFETENNGARRFVGPVSYAGHTIERLPDKNHNKRDAIVFKLVGTEVPPLTLTEQPVPKEALSFMAIRGAALDASRDVTEKVKTAQERRKRSRTISTYIQQRACGYCEICGYSAPFSRPDGSPYLESHHLTQVADDGPDAPEDVVAACPTCHRKIHHGIDGVAINKKTHERIRAVEKAIEGGKFFVVSAAIIRNGDGQLLITKRKSEQDGGGKWEFPGGKVHEGETLQNSLLREIKEELNLNIKEPTRFIMVDYQGDLKAFRLCAMETAIESGDFELKAHEDSRWVSPSELGRYDLLPADVLIAEALKGD